MIDLLLSSGADINGRSHWWAGGFGVLDDGRGLADFLIARGARIDAHAASRLGMLDKLCELVAADPGVVAVRGGTDRPRSISPARSKSLGIFSNKGPTLTPLMSITNPPPRSL